MKRENWLRWLKLAGALLALLAISFALAYFLNDLANRLHLPLDRYAALAYLIVFVVSLVANLTVMAPVSIGMTMMMAVAAEWNPALAALAAATGGALGELSGYFAGYAGRSVIKPDGIMGYKRVEGWVNRYGAWAIVFLAFQPVIPFDVGGLIAGAVRMPLVKFMPALFAGKLPKYLLMAYAGVGLIHFLPSWFR